MKKIVFLISVCSIGFISCKKDQVKPSNEHELVEVELSEKPSFHYNLEWTAFKTPEKVGVSGTFGKITLENTTKSDNFETYLTAATFTIDTESVNTKDSERDAKLVKGFFKLMDGNISGKFVRFENNQAIIDITANNHTKEFSFAIDKANDSITISGTVDIVKDFQAESALNSIHEMCKELHAGKTWSDVDIKITFSK